MKTTIGEIKTLALALWREGYRCDKRGRPLDESKPLIPAIIAGRLGVTLAVAAQVNHVLIAWSLGVVPVGEYDKL